MKKFNVLLSVILILSVSCNKEIENIESICHESELKSVTDSVGGYYTDSAFIDNDGLTYNYYIDGIRVRTYDFHKQLTDYSEYIVVSPEYDNTGKISGIAINEFSTVDGYIIFGQRRGDNYWKVIEFEKLISEYAHNNGLDQVFESTGTYPTSFINWIDQKVETIFGPQSNTTDGMFTIYKDFYGSGSAWHSVTGKMLFMPPGWNDKVSSFRSLHIYGFSIFYDKTMFRKRMITITDFGWHLWNFQGPLKFVNDRTSSCLDIG